MRQHSLLLALVTSAAILTACSNKEDPSKFSEPSTPTKPAPTTSPPEPPLSTVPPASSTTGSPADKGQGARDSASSNPSGSLDKKDKSAGMPQESIQR